MLMLTTLQRKHLLIQQVYITFAGVIKIKGPKQG